LNLATLQQRYDEALDAQHALLTGTAVVEFRDQNGELVKYNQASAGRLGAYIQDLARQLGTVIPQGPMSVFL
jgi:hypothetical protein